MLTDRDIALFARSAVEFQDDVFGASTEERKVRRLHQHRLVATAYYLKAQQDVRDSGYRLTQRVKDGLWAELKRIEEEATRPQLREAA